MSKFSNNVTNMEFIKSSILGKKYKNNIFENGYNNDNIYYFEINDTKTKIKLGI
jgi:hypothetical protein